MLPPLTCFPRDRRVSVKCQPSSVKRRTGHVTVTRLRKGRKACTNSAWRRTDTGSNHISAYGVWRDHARRAKARANRTGETRWYRLPAAARAANFLLERC